jgi:hypothetical protein
MYHNITTQIRCTSGTSQEFPLEVGVHQGSVLSPLLFILVMNYLTHQEMNSVLKTLLFADDVVLISENLDDIQNTLEKWRQTLENNGLKISRKKTEYLYLPFSNPAAPTPSIKLDGEILSNCDFFKYLGSIIHKDGGCAADVDHRMGVGWLKFRSISGVLCDPKMPIKLKGKAYQTIVRPAILYGSECWTMYKTYSKQLETTEMRMLRWSSGVSLRDKIKSSHIRGSMGVTDINKKVEERQLRWYGHVKRRPPDHVVNKAMAMDLPRLPSRGKPRNTWMTQCSRSLERNGLQESDIFNRRSYSLRTRRADPNSLARQ